MKKVLTPIILAGALAASQALAEDSEQAAPPASLAELAAASDLIAVVRVLDTDYEYTRKFPSGGRAFLEVMIPYKLSRPLEDIIEVYEEGLHENECYFDNPSVFEEGRRHLVFLKFSEDVEGQYNGIEQGCKLDVLVTDTNQYALRFPVKGIDVKDDLSSIAEAMNFADNYAVLEFEDLTVPERQALEQNGHLVRNGDTYKYTHGVDLSAVRKLMGPDALTLDRSLRNPPPVNDQDTIR